MKPEDVAAFGSLIPYWGFGLATAASFYGGMVWVGNHFRPEFKQQLSGWLSGSYESSWVRQFCQLFDTVFGPKHLSLKRFFRSAIASVISVLLLYILFAHVLGVLGARTFGAVSLLSALLIGAAVNIIPDYLSLVETRWLIERFERVRSVPGQILLLIVDFIFSAVIILAGIYAYSWLFSDQRLPSLVEIVALFSVYAIFFYSTFLTSVWAWLYCVSTWFVRLFTRLGLGRILDTKDNPVKQIALVGSALIVLGGLAIGPILKPEKGGFVAAFDEFICGLDLNACFHAARAADDLERTVHYMEIACGDEIESGNCGERLRDYLGQSPSGASDIWRRACEGGYARGCRAYGGTYRSGEGAAIDLKRAVALYLQACDGKDMGGCSNLGAMYAKGDGVAADAKRAAELFRQACDGKDLGGCNNLGAMYAKGDGIAADAKRAVDLYRQVCDGKDMRGCSNLGWMYEKGEGVAADVKRAVELYQQACGGKDTRGCFNLGVMYAKGDGVAADAKRAVDLYHRACEFGDGLACKHAKALEARLSLSNP